MFCTPRLLRSIANGLEPAVGKFGLQRIVVEWVVLPEILLQKPDDVKLLGLRVVPVPGLVLGNEVFVSTGSYRPAHAPNIHLGTSVVQVWQILYANAVAYIEAGGHVFSISAFHSGTSPLRASRAVQSARRGSCRQAFALRPKSSVRSKGTRSRVIDPDRCCPGGAFPRRSTRPANRAPRR